MSKEDRKRSERECKTRPSLPFVVLEVYTGYEPSYLELRCEECGAGSIVLVRGDTIPGPPIRGSGICGHVEHAVRVFLDKWSFRAGSSDCEGVRRHLLALAVMET